MNNRQRANLLKLATYLESLPRDYKHFDMWSYADHRGACDLAMDEDVYAAKEPKAFLTNCGTVACAVGHGPAAGIKPLDSEFAISGKAGEPFSFQWNDYAARVFDTPPRAMTFYFLFGSDWRHFDNHHYGAAARIRYFLETGQALETKAASRRRYAPYHKGSRSAKRREIDAVPA